MDIYTKDLLRRGSFFVSDYFNVASPVGMALQSAIRDGHVTSKWASIGTWYSVTNKGRAALERDRIDRLAEIGVYEVHER